MRIGKASGMLHQIDFPVFFFNLKKIHTTVEDDSAILCTIYANGLIQFLKIFMNTSSDIISSVISTDTIY
jgi:hypothetical protein